MFGALVLYSYVFMIEGFTPKMELIEYRLSRQGWSAVLIYPNIPYVNLDMLLPFGMKRHYSSEWSVECESKKCTAKTKILGWEP